MVNVHEGVVDACVGLEVKKPLKTQKRGSNPLLALRDEARAGDVEGERDPAGERAAEAAAHEVDEALVATRALEAQQLEAPQRQALERDELETRYGSLSYNLA